MGDFQYPIGKFQPQHDVTAEVREKWIDSLVAAPKNLRLAIDGLSSEQLDTPYRPNGWTVRQVVHHLPDSHMNSFIRFKLALTEDQPLIKPYAEDRWAELGDYRDTPIEVSLSLMDSLHQRWVTLLHTLQDEDYTLAFKNPESGVILNLETALGLYAWHGRHHIGQINSLRERMGW